MGESNKEYTNYDREEELNQLISTKTGVKGLVDSDISHIPNIFILPKPDRFIPSPPGPHPQVPVVNLASPRDEIVRRLRDASETWGVFQMENHGVKRSVMEDVLASVTRFHEQEKEVKKEIYSHESSKKAWFSVTLNRRIKCALWKDTLAFQFEDLSSDSEALPLICRKAMVDYMKEVIELKNKISGLLAEALGLESDQLERLECMEPRKMVGHYYPPCPEPHLTMGTTMHSDPYSLTILLQGHIDGLQFLHGGQWVSAPPQEGALIAIIGDMLQLISNDKFKSAEHRVLANKIGPRISAACFFFPSSKNRDRVYQPLNELVTDKSRPRYREVTHPEYVKCFMMEGNCASKVLPLFRL